jgi:hypothetical protein
MDLWEVLLPPGLRLLSDELQAVDALLDDEIFLAPFTARWPARSAGPRSRWRPTCGSCT